MNPKLPGTLGVVLLAASLNAQSLIQVVPLVNNAPMLSEPNGVVVDFANNYYVVDGGNANRIYQISPDGTAPLPSPVPFAGQEGVAGAADGVGDAASFNEPWGIVFVPSRGGLIVSDQANQLLRFVALDRTVTTIAGQLDPVNGGGFADGVGTNAQFSFPAGMTVDSVGNVYIADMGNGAIRMLAPNNAVSTVISNLHQPTAVAMSSDTEMWVADSANNQVVRYAFTAGSWKAMDVVGDVHGGYQDSVNANKAKFSQPRGLLWLGGGTGLVVADTGNNSVREISGVPGAYTVTTLTSGNLNTPLGMTYDVEGRIVVADSKSSTLKALIRGSQPTPIVMPASGAYSNALNVTFSTSFLGVHLFRYTTSQNAPGLNSSIGNGVTFDGNATPVQVRSFSPDALTSPLVSNFYTFFVDAPVMSPSSQSAQNAVTITVSEATLGASLYYTVDGSEPTMSSTPIVGGTFSLATTNAGVKIKGFKAGYTNSVSAIGQFIFTVADPVISVPAGVYSNDVAVALTSATTNAVIYWTTDGTDPSLVNGSSAPIANITHSCTLKAKAFRNGFVDSGMVTATYDMATATPQISPAGATNINVVSFTVTEATAGAALRWTIDGSTPTLASAACVSGVPFVIGANGVLTVKAFRTGYDDSAPAAVPVSLTVDSIVMTPLSASTNNPIAITLTTGTTGAKIYWTIDSSEPTATGPNFVNNGGTVLLKTNGLFKAKAFLSGFTASPTVSGQFNLQTDKPQIMASTTSSNNVIPVTLTSATANSIIYWTIDGTTPTSSSPNWVTNGGSIILGTNGTLQARAVLPNSGFLDSDVASTAFVLAVSNPRITPPGATNNNMVWVTLTNLGVGTYYYTLDGTLPSSANGMVYTNAFLLSNNCVVTAIGSKAGFADSSVVIANFNLSVAPVTVTPINSTAINSNSVSITDATTNALIAVTLTALDGSTVTNLNYTNTPGTPIVIPITDNELMSISATYAGFVPAQAGPYTYQIQVDQPQMSPQGGYFPSGAEVTLSVIRPNAAIYYTLNGQTPTTNDNLYTGPIDLNGIQFPKLDLRIVKAVAFAPNTLPSVVRSGQSLASNSVSVASSIIGGAGATIVLPVVINLQTNQTLRSLQFKMEISPATGGATPNTNTPLEAVALTANDYVQVAGNSAAGYTASFNTGAYAVGTTNGMIFYSLATNLFITDFGVLANVKVTIPGTAPVGSTYKVVITNISGTSDAGQLGVTLTSTPGTITVSNYVYLAGDCSPGRWYNAGDFGNDELDNADVNAAFQASLEISKPYPGTDAFNAMDVYPESGGNASGAGGIVGDGLITYLDWQHILLRSLGRETNSWKRWWENGTLHHKRIDGPNLVRLRGESAPLALTAPSMDIWLRHALVWGDIITNATPGGSYSMAIYARVLPGIALNGLQLRAVMEAVGSAPAPGAVQFVGSDAMGQPTSVIQPGSNDVAFAWSLGRPVDPLVNSNLIGYVKFVVPANAIAGQHYMISLKYPQGATDLDTERQLESAAGQVWVLSSPAKPVVHIISDQWKTNFFGSLTNPNADADADPDHDGIPNWMEYLAGTNPTNANSHLSFSGADRPQTGRGIILNWPAMTGRVYVLEASSTLVGGTWTPVSTNILGDGTLRSFTTTDASGKAQFYRIRLVEQ